MEAQLFPVLHLCLGGIVDDEVRLLLEVGLCLGADEHVGHEVCLPCHLHDEAHLHAGVAVCAAETVHDIQLLVGELLLCDFLHGIPSLLAGAVVVVMVFFGIPPYCVVRGLVVNDELVLGRAACVDAGHHIDSAQLSLLSLVEACEAFLCLLVEQYLIRGVVQNLCSTCLDSVSC